MIWNQWYAILESRELKKRHRLLSIKRLGDRLVLWRNSEDIVICLFDQCAHRGAALSCGEIVDDEVQCPFHGLQFNTEGKCTYIPSRGRSYKVPPNYKVHSYPTKELHGFIWLWWGDFQEEYPEIIWFEDLGEDFLYSTNIDPWKIQYSRAIENQLDVAHLWIVHKTTIGRGDARVSDGPVTKWEDGVLKAWVRNHQEDGTISRLPNELGAPSRPPMINFIMPNIWMLHLGAGARVFVAFVPVDDEHTLLYQRFYQRYFKVPLIGKAMTWVSNKFNKIILHQDRRVVQTQMPKQSGLKIGENLFPADAPIIAYRKKRDDLQKKIPAPLILNQSLRKRLLIDEFNHATSISKLVSNQVEFHLIPVLLFFLRFFQRDKSLQENTQPFRIP